MKFFLRFSIVARAAPPFRLFPRSPLFSTPIVKALSFNAPILTPSRRDARQTLKKRKPRRNLKSRRGLIPDPGVEPGRPRGQWILNPSRLPIPPIRRKSERNIVSLTIHTLILTAFFQNASPLFHFSQNFLKKQAKSAVSPPSIFRRCNNRSCGNPP